MEKGRMYIFGLECFTGFNGLYGQGISSEMGEGGNRGKANPSAGFT